jgi:F0F1-type ATP synthase membrane subunit c/vacuolar-type H+-ATPase subunit K
VFCAYHWIGARKQGLLPYLKHFSGPVPLALKPLMFVIEVISHLARPLSLTLRLFGNMVGGHILLAVIFLLMGLDGLLGWALSGSLPGIVIGGIGSLVTVVFTVGFLYPLKILVAFLQAFIFVMLTMLYISGATEEAEHHSEHTSRITRIEEGVVRRSLILGVLAVLAVPTAAMAAEGGTGGWVGPFAVIAAGIGMAIAAGLCGLGQGRAVASAVDAMARQPGAAARIQTAMIIGLALIESLAIYTLVIALILLFVKGIQF